MKVVLFVLSQVFVAIALFYIVLSILSKNKRAIVFYRIPSSVFYAASYALQSLWLACGNMIFGLVRFFSYYAFKIKGKKLNLIVLIFFLVGVAVMGWLLWEGLLSLLMIFTGVIMAWVFWQDNEKITRLVLPSVTFMMLAYNIIVLNYVGIVLECVVQVFQIISIVRFDILKKGSLLKEKE